jgi:hypothetical protein
MVGYSAVVLSVLRRSRKGNGSGSKGRRAIERRRDEGREQQCGKRAKRPAWDTVISLHNQNRSVPNTATLFCQIKLTYVGAFSAVAAATCYFYRERSSFKCSLGDGARSIFHRTVSTGAGAAPGTAITSPITADFHFNKQTREDARMPSEILGLT